MNHKHTENRTSSPIPAPFAELQRSLPSRVAAISPFVDEVMRFIRALMGKFGGAEDHKDEIEVALHEALANAVVHGNHEESGKQVHVICRCSMDGELLITVRDEGEGFDSSAVPDPTEAQRRLLPHGRGLYVMRALMDEVWFEENGTAVRMRKRMNPPTG
jgi:serine/threonine-protein kinase RsbW